MFGWTGRFLRVDLSTGKAVADSYDVAIAKSLSKAEGLLSRFYGKN